MLRSKYGSLSVPTRSRGIVLAVVISVFFLIFTIVGAAAHGGVSLMYVGVFGIFLGVWCGIYNSGKAAIYDQAYQRYQARRSETARQLDQTGKPQLGNRGIPL